VTTPIVVDASVVAKWYLPERDHESARALRDAYLEGRCRLLAPALLPFEVVNALAFSGHYDGEGLEEAAETLPEYGIQLVPFGAIGPVARVARDADVTVYDAAYVALASSRASVVYTADERLIESVGEGEYGDIVRHVRSYGGLDSSDCS
jgi:predicted nucleic acid-binding protein